MIFTINTIKNKQENTTKVALIHPKTNIIPPAIYMKTKDNNAITGISNIIEIAIIEENMMFLFLSIKEKVSSLL